MTQAHHDWLESVARTVAEDFERLRATAAASSANVQQVGHGGDSPWVILLKQCVPPGYEIGRRKYIFAEEGGEEFETDLVVFHPAYPSALRDQERVLAAGVAAAFSVKLTADAAGLQEAA